MKKLGHTDYSILMEITKEINNEQKKKGGKTSLGYTLVAALNEIYPSRAREVQALQCNPTQDDENISDFIKFIFDDDAISKIPAFMLNKPSDFDFKIEKNGKVFICKNAEQFIFQQMAGAKAYVNTQLVFDSANFRKSLSYYANNELLTMKRILNEHLDTILK